MSDEINIGDDYKISMPNFKTPDFSSMLRASIPTIPISKINPARWTYERLIEYIKDFENELDSEHEIGARLVSFNTATVFHIQDLGYYGPDIISFNGINENGENVQLIQNVSQLNVLLVAVKKIKDKPRRIGFDLEKKLNETKSKEQNDENK